MTLVDIVARVSAQKTAYSDLIVGVIGRSRLGRKWQISQCVDTSGTANKDLALILRVEVYEVLALDHTLAQVEGSGQTCLLIYGEECFECRVRHRLVDKQSQCCGDTDAVIRSECSAFGLNPAVIDIGLDSVVLEVKHLVRVLLADHIGVRLQHYGWAILVALGCSLANYDIADSIALILQVVFLGKLHEVFAYLLLFLRWAWHLRNLVEESPHQLWL